MLVIISVAPIELAWMFLSWAVDAKANEVPNELVTILLAPTLTSWAVDAKNSDVPKVLVMILLAPIELA